MDNNLMELNTAFAKAITEVTVDTVSNRISAIKSNRDAKKQVTEYDQLINELLDNRNNLELISRNYKERLERVTISDDDIESLHKTVTKIIEILKPFSSDDGEDSSESLNTIIELLNSDTLKTLQLLGYNYKEAIGEPLTEITANFLKEKLSVKQTGKNA
ncbi:hypothetical protein [Companilactobacillus farciminis]|uniref:hypothetical protein n=1 Tax=Companilactobacillus farciminis TaxID=1612 RepID=UPI001916AB22|nr:hypothetical protein [Companilactobacillus farciminis]WCG35732.1 hypothetical protein PML84_00700 [Companilactobacillus farciminis]